ncbi:MAG: element excision factor XisI family protein [Limnoraphis robusta]
MIKSTTISNFSQAIFHSTRCKNREGTEDEVAYEFFKAGIPKYSIVLGFCFSEVRKYTYLSN